MKLKSFQYANRKCSSFRKQVSFTTRKFTLENSLLLRPTFVSVFAIGMKSEDDFFTFTELFTSLLYVLPAHEGFHRNTLLGRQQGKPVFVIQPINIILLNLQDCLGLYDTYTYTYTCRHTMFCFVLDKARSLRIENYHKCQSLATQGYLGKVTES